MLIRNCRFKFSCPQTWDTLDSIGNPTIRWCSNCSQGVHLCKTEQELMAALAENHCVAIPEKSRVRRELPHLQSRVFDCKTDFLGVIVMESPEGGWLHWDD